MCSSLCELLGEFSPELLDQLGYRAEHTTLIHRFRPGISGLVRLPDRSDDPPTPREDDTTRHVAETTVRRVLADL